MDTHVDIMKQDGSTKVIHVFNCRENNIQEDGKVSVKEMGEDAVGIFEDFTSLSKISIHSDFDPNDNCFIYLYAFAGDML